MTYTTMVYKATSGQWSWSILDDDRTPISSGAGYASEDEAEADADMELSAHIDANETAHVVSVEIPPEFAAHCVAHGLSPGQVLTAFMADLGETSQSNGSDERAQAASWFDRVIWPDADDELAMDWGTPPRVRADGEVLTGIDAMDYPPDIAHPGNDDATMGMAWWNALDVTERQNWLNVAGTAVVADAWVAWKRSQAEEVQAFNADRASQTGPAMGDLGR